MTRMGHDSARAASIYQHATAQADKAIAEALDAAVRAMQEEKPEAADEGKDDPEDGSAGVLAGR